MDNWRGSFGSEGGSAEAQIEERERLSSIARRRSSQTGDEPSLRPSMSGSKSSRSAGSGLHLDGLPKVFDDEKEDSKLDHTLVTGASRRSSPFAYRGNVNQASDGGSSDAMPYSTSGLKLSQTAPTPQSDSRYRTSPFENGYHFPPKHTRTESAMIFLKKFWNYTATWQGFLMVIYGLNVVAWGE